MKHKRSRDYMNRNRKRKEDKIKTTREVLGIVGLMLTLATQVVKLIKALFD